jgi:putative ABC transport system substrate-binding protein
MRRRAFLYGSVAMLGAPLAAEAQKVGKVHRVGVLTNVPPSTPQASRNWEAFRQGLRERGWIEGRSIVIEFRFAEGRMERFPALAAELVTLRPDIIVALPNAAAHAAKQAAAGTIPIVMIYVFDPVGDGLVASLARPGGNVTGLTPVVNQGLVGKQLELIKEAIPNVSRVAALTETPANRTNPLLVGYVKELDAAAQALAVTIRPFYARNAEELPDVFAAMSRERVEALLVLPSPLTYAFAGRIIDLAAKTRLPAVYHFRESVEAGGLMAYGVNAPEMFRRAATYVDKIFKGARPGDLPVEQPTTFELVINLKTAKAIGLTIPPSLLARADQVIE